MLLLATGFLLGGLVLALRLKQEEKLETASLFTAALIESIRNDSTFYRSYLPHNTEAEVSKYRSLMSEEFEVVYHDHSISLDIFELGLRFSNGARAYLDVYQDEERVTHALISVYASAAPRQ